MMRSVQKLWRNADGAVAPTVALSLTALIAASGIAFDYSRVASMHTELQDAADQAALAAASQLDGESGACVRASAAAASLLTNKTRFADQSSGGSTVAVPTGGAGCGGNGSIHFYKTYDQVTDTPGAIATKDSEAKVVIVSVTPRQAVYYLTPIVAAFHSADINAQAVASLQSGICKTPPVMLCNPDEPAGNSDPSLAYNPTRGIGLRLITGDATVPGNFGWLQAYDTNGSPISGASNLKKEIGYNTPPGDCQPVDGVNTKTGMDTSVLDAFNSRFDVFANGNSTCPNGGTCSPAIDTRKDLVCRPNNSNTACRNSTWSEASNPYHPTSTTPLPVGGGSDPSTMGYPMDLCHAVKKSANTCGVPGNGNWDRDAYFRVNYGWTHAQWTAQLGNSTPSRFDVYTWEQAHQNVGGKGMAVPKIISANEAAFSYPASGNGSGLASPDRRQLSVAVLNCRADSVRGMSTNVPVATWLDVFLVQPAFQRGPNNPSQIFTDQKDIYVEVIGPTKVGQGEGLVLRRDVPYLIK